LVVVSVPRSSFRVPRSVPGTDVPMFAGNAQHTAVYSAPAAELNAIRWTTPIDLHANGALAHYGAPLVTTGNSVIVPVKTESDGFQINVLDGATGRPRRATISTDYVLPAHNWIPTYNPALATTSVDRRASVSRLYYAGAGGTLFYIANPDSIR